MTSGGAEASGAVAVVTGARGNLGQAVVEQLSARGDRVVCVERDRVVVASSGETLSTIDLGDPDATRHAIDVIERRVGPVASAVHTVGAFRFSGPIAEANLDDFGELFATHVLSTVHLLRALVPPMRSRRAGRIVAVASASALDAPALTAAYAASKAAELSLVQSVAAELRGSGVAGSAVLPGTMDTPQNRAAMPDANPSTWVSLRSVAYLICCLTAPDAAALSGEAIRIGRA